MKNFIFLTSNSPDYARMFYEDIKKYVSFIGPFFLGNSVALYFIVKLFFSPRIYSYIKLPFRTFFYKKICKKMTCKDDVYIVMDVGWYTPDFVYYLRSNLCGVKIVLLFTDTFSSKKKLIPFLNGEQIKKDFDLVLSYNPDDVAEYGFTYSPVYYSKFRNYESLFTYEHYDFLFIGVEKNRIEKILALYDTLTNKGFKCLFYIVSSKKHDCQKDGLIFSDKYVNYVEYLRMLKSSKCIIEIIDPGTKGNTLRYWESVFYNKLLLSDLPDIEKMKFFNANYMFKIADVEKIDFYRALQRNVNFHYKDEMSPIHLLEKISQLIV